MNFDAYFLHFPPLDRQDDFNLFWHYALTDLKRIPMEPKSQLDKRKSSAKFKVTNIVYHSFQKTPIHGTLYVPQKKSKPKIVLIIHDYNKPYPYKGYQFDDKIAYFFIQLRGHHLLTYENPKIKESKKIAASPGYMVEQILDPETYYVKGIYLDIIRAIDLLRLSRKFDCSSIGVIGKGFGGAAALFAAAYSKRITAVMLDAPAFMYLQLSQNISKNELTAEINNFIAHSKSQKQAIKKNLSYFDALNFTDKISCPVLLNIGLKNQASPPACAFSVFNHLLCDKTAEIFPLEAEDAGGEKMLIKSIKWLRKKMDQA